jgi:hypothetical protein
MNFPCGVDRGIRKQLQPKGFGRRAVRPRSALWRVKWRRNDPEKLSPDRAAGIHKTHPILAAEDYHKNHSAHKNAGRRGISNPIWRRTVMIFVAAQTILRAPVARSP